MKKIFYKIAVLALVITGTTSCDDKLDQIPFDEFGTENAYVSAQDFENAIRGVYSGLTAGSFYGGSDGGGMLDMPDVLSDNVTLAQVGRKSRREYHNFRYNAASPAMSGLYQSAYRVIFRANTLLSKAEAFDGETKENIVAEAKALRALAHFDIVSFFGKIPTQSGDANGSLGIAYVTDPDPNIEPSRETVGAVYEKIVKDLTEAVVDINDDNGVGRLGKDGVNIILSRVYLYMGEWQKAYNAANAVTATVAPRAGFPDIWTDQNQDGLVFYIPVHPPVLDNTIGVMWSQGSLSSLIPEYVVSYGLFQKYSNDDIRKEAYIADAHNGSSNFNAIIKYFKRPGGAAGEVDIKILRAAEAQLNKAEALYNMGGRETEARAALDKVRSERYTSFPGGETGTALRDAIRLERRLEFAFEAQRFFDLKRWGLSVNREGFGDLADGSGTPDDVLLLEAGNFKFQMPISQSAIDVNQNLVQNPGY